VTAMPVPHLFTVAEYVALGEIESGYAELQEGHLHMSPSPTYKHNQASYRLTKQLEAQLPDGFDFCQDIDVDLELAPSDQPGFVRRPDLVILRSEALNRVDDEGGLFRASEVVLIVEIVSPGSRRTDYMVKRAEYADAGIPNYWIVDLQPPVSLVACHLAGEFGYQDAPAVTGEFTTTVPFPLTVRIDALD
jgi:Uma2 family endonuclease